MTARNIDQIEVQEPIPHWHSPGSPDRTLVDGDGAYVTDQSGERYLDFVSQLYCTNAGYGNDAIIKAMQEQLQRIQYVAPKNHSESRSKLTKQLVDVGPSSLSDVLFSVTGSGAVELAIHTAREYQDAPKILSRYRSYHGSTYGSGSLTTEPFTKNTLEEYAATTGHAHFLPPLTDRSLYNSDSPGEIAELAAENVEFVIKNEGPDSVAAIITEIVAGTSGGYTAPPGYFARLREICDRYDCLLIADEVLTGFGRCGDWFACQTEDLDPDIMTFAKAVTGAYSPLAGVMMKEEIADAIMENGFNIGQTWGGHPVSCAAGTAAIEEYGSGLIDNVQRLSSNIQSGLEELERDHPIVGNVDGRGFLWSIQLNDPDTGEPMYDHRVEDGDDPMYALAGRIAEIHNIFIGTGRPTFNMMFAPPFCIDQADIDATIDALHEELPNVEY